MFKDITELFVFVDDFCNAVDQHSVKGQIPDQKKSKPTRVPDMTISEIMTIMILFQQSPCKNFKYFYKICLIIRKAEFPRLVSYNRFVELQRRCFPYLLLLLQWFFRQIDPNGINFIDATYVAVCNNKRIFTNKVFKGLAKRGKSTMGWFYGFKLHLVINAKGELQGAQLTAGNVDDRAPVPAITKRLKGLLFGDKGYIDQKLFDELYERGLKLVTNVKKNMKNKFMTIQEKTLLRKRSIIETVNGCLKTTFQLVHTRHRSPDNFLVHIFSTLVAYCLKPGKPMVRFDNLIPN